MNNFVFICLMILIIFISFIGFIGYYENRLKKEVDKNCFYEYDLEAKYKLICEQCDRTIKEFNEIMFGSPPLKNKVIIVRSIKDYDYSAYRKDIDSLNEYLDNGWSIVSHESDEFVHTYILGMPLKWLEEGDVNDE